MIKTGMLPVPTCKKLMKLLIPLLVTLPFVSLVVARNELLQHVYPSRECKIRPDLGYDLRL